MSERGAALLLALLTLVLLGALGAGLVVSSATDVRIAANDRDLHEAVHVADAILANAIAGLGRRSDWDAVLSGGTSSTFIDGAPGGTRRLDDGSAIDLTAIVNEANCGHAGACTAAERQALTPERPWGVNNPIWHLFAYGPSSRLVDEAAGDRGWYVLVLVADDQSERDGDPQRDAAAGQPGSGIIALRAIASGPRGMRQTIDATISRAGGGPTIGVRVLSWRWTL